jgi:hypothetical protein
VHWAWIALGYVTYLAAASLARPAFRRARGPLLLAGTAAWGVVVAMQVAWPSGISLPSPMLIALPALLLLGGYWLSGLLFVGPDVRLERWLCAVDATVIERAGALRCVRWAPGAVAEYFELSYLAVYLAIPAGAMTLAAAGHLDQVSRFWTVVLLAEFACYGMLPWVQTRPPRLLEAADRAHGAVLRRVNLELVDRASIQANTLPSGHAAGAVAAALVVASTMPVAGALFLALAASITVATVVGRYHYSVDAASGVIVALAAWWIV